MHTKVLLLTAWYFPTKILSWQDAVKMVYEETVEVVSEYDETISSPSVTWNMPAVIRLKKSTRNHKKGVKFSRVNLYTRDKYKCQYCNKGPLPVRALSYDHVIPRASGGQTTWTNIVAACKTCNSLKDDKSCDQAGMWPRTNPYRPKTLPLTAPIIQEDDAPEEWLPFLKPVVA